MAQTILVVDDDPVQRRLLETAISRSGMHVVTAPGGQPALELIGGPRGEQITLMMLDLVMPDMGGLDVLAKLRATNPDLPVIVLTAKGGIDSAVEAMRAGANDFLVKPASPERIAVSIRNQLKIGTLSGEVKQLKKKADNRLTFDDLIAGSPEMKQVFRAGGARRPERYSRADRRRIGRRQGTDRPRHSRHRRAQRQALRDRGTAARSPRI